MTNEIEIIALNQFYQLVNSQARYILHRGSTRSGKTIGIIQYLINELINNKINIVIGVETIRNARGTIIKDLDEWINIFGVLDNFDINKTNYTYVYKPNGSSISIIPCDKDSKWYGLKADIFFFNEATHIDKSFFEQAQMRLPDRKNYRCRIILDFNPTNPYSWVRELESANLPGGVDVFVSTYRDNPFLGEKQKKTIEGFKEENYNKWLVFAQGEYGEVRGAIYTKWKLCDTFPKTDKVWYGLDFGFTNDPTSFNRVTMMNGEIFIDELIYDKGLTNQDIGNLLVELGIDKRAEIIADSSEPKSIEELKRMGWNVKGINKFPNSVQVGIDILQRYNINITKRSKNIQDEIINYTWKEDRKKGEFTNNPSDSWNHALDNLRYVALQYLYQKSKPMIRVR